MEILCDEVWVMIVYGVKGLEVLVVFMVDIILFLVDL